MNARSGTAEVAATMYVYYRVTGDKGLARRAVGDMMAALEERTGVCGRLLRRCDDPDTWMEVFAPLHDVAQFTRELAACELQHRVGQWAEHGLRHRECFVAVEPSSAS